MKVLICDDDPSALAKGELILRKQGYDTLALEKSRDALVALCSPQPPKIAILDWMMPEYSGIDICEKVRKQSTSISIYIIILTSRDQPEDLEKAFAAGANDYITKPFRPFEFKARVGAGERIVGLESELRTLSGLLPICSWCKKVHLRDESKWIQIEEYVQDHSYAQFSHGGCPDCVSKFRDKK